MENETLVNRPYYDFARPVDPNTSFLSDPFFRALVKTRAFKRLQSVRFLGAIDYMLVRSPNGAKNNVRYTRHQHSLGVARLAYYYANLLGLSQKECRLVTVSGLLHDIGHAPLSHSLEPVFREYFGLEHHQATSAIIRGKTSLGLEVSQLLREYNIDIDHVISLLSRENHDFNDFFSGPINFDTIDAILRALSYIKPNTPTVSPESVVEAATLRAIGAHATLVDEFWSYKAYIYKTIIGSLVGVIADSLSQHYMRTNIDKFSKDDYYITEREIFYKLPGLYNKLKNCTIGANMDKVLPPTYKVRNFSVDKGYDFFTRDDFRRYTQSRYTRILSIPQNNSEKAETNLELFV